jgi:ABC-type sugar transport system ATPase subunit
LLLEAISVKKTFRGVRALDGADIAIAEGEIHALVGPNGAGKSTLAHILSGIITPDSGTIIWNGREVRMNGAISALKMGIGTVFQESSLLPNIGTGANLLLGNEPRNKFGFIDEKKLWEKASELLSGAGLNRVDPNDPAGKLSSAESRFVELARASYIGASLVILDEPASGLPERDRDAMLSFISGLRARGTSVLLITHDTADIGICDRVSEMRDGRVSAPREGSPSGETPSYPPKEGVPGEAVFEYGQTGLSVLRGEITGILGLSDGGKSELLRRVFGVDPRDRGGMSFFGIKMRVGPPGGSIKHRVGLSGDERKLRCVALAVTVRKKAAYASVEKSGLLSSDESGLSAFGIGSRPRDPVAETEALIQDLSKPGGADIGAPGPFKDADIAVFDEPSRGADAASRGEIYKLMRELSRAGRGVLLLSHDSGEIAGMCDAAYETRGDRFVKTG